MLEDRPKELPRITARKCHSHIENQILLAPTIFLTVIFCFLSGSSTFLMLLNESGTISLVLGSKLPSTVSERSKLKLTLNVKTFLCYLEHLLPYCHDSDSFHEGHRCSTVHRMTQSQVFFIPFVIKKILSFSLQRRFIILTPCNT